MFFTTIALSVVALVIIIFIVRDHKKKDSITRHEYLKEKDEGIID